MWDLGQIIQQNNQIALDWMMRSPTMQQMEDVQLDAWPLKLLGDKMQAGPVKLTHLASYFTDHRVLRGFISLVEEFLPEHMQEIMSQPLNKRVYKFAYLFSKKYYPLYPASYEQSMDEFTSNLPVVLMGFSYDAYHHLDMTDGFLMLLSLVTYPFNGDERDEMDAEDAIEQGEDYEGARIPLLDRVGHIVGDDLARRIPLAGWIPEQLHVMTSDTAHPGLGEFADWVFGQTGTVVLDSNYENCNYREGYGEPVFDWSRHNVKLLSEEWPKVRRIRSKVHNLVDWLEFEPRQHFQELLEYLLAQPLPKNTKAAPVRIDREEEVALDQPYLDNDECDEEEEEDNDNGITPASGNPESAELQIANR